MPDFLDFAGPIAYLDTPTADGRWLPTRPLNEIADLPIPVFLACPPPPGSDRPEVTVLTMVGALLSVYSDSADPTILKGRGRLYPEAFPAYRGADIVERLMDGDPLSCGVEVEFAEGGVQKGWWLRALGLYEGGAAEPAWAGAHVRVAQGL